MNDSSEQSDIRPAIVRHYAPQLWGTSGSGPFSGVAIQQVIEDADRGDVGAVSIVRRCEHRHATLLFLENFLMPHYTQDQLDNLGVRRDDQYTKLMS